MRGASYRLGIKSKLTEKELRIKALLGVKKAFLYNKMIVKVDVYLLFFIKYTGSLLLAGGGAAAS